MSPAKSDEWSAHGRDLQETRFSPLAQITRDNIQDLAVRWTAPLPSPPGRHEATPLYSAGTIYTTTPWGLVYAVDAGTGSVIWRWDPQVDQYGPGATLICCGPANRGVALYQHRVYVGVLDGRLVALDASSGEPVWTRQVAPVVTNYSITGAPRLAGGRVIIGTAGADFGARGFVAAFNAETGAELWRTYTVPGNPATGFEAPDLESAAETWSGEWWRTGGGGTAWDGITYDPAADLLYVGVGNGSPWSRTHRSNGIGDNLYLASVLALNPLTGAITWHYQTTPGEQWGYTATQQMILADLSLEGGVRRVLMQAPKNGFFYVVDRVTGEFISAAPFAHVTWASRIDEGTGRPVEDSRARYGMDGRWVAPGPKGAHTWAPMSWSPRTRLVYIPAEDNHSFYRDVETFREVPGQFNTGLDASGVVPPVPDSFPETSGFLVAWDPVLQEARWRVALGGLSNGGVMTTGADIVFVGANIGALKALDAHTGAELWSWEIGVGPGSPVSFSDDGRQFIVIQASGKLWAFTLGGA